MSDAVIDYDAIVQEALKSVVRVVLSDVADNGLPGDHHFYIAFRTQDDGVTVPQHLIDRFPEEMTIVIQHKFWGLAVHEAYFEVGLSFNQQPETLIIPFSAVTGFVDPSVQFALQFQDGVANDETVSQMERDSQNALLLSDPGDDPEPVDADASVAAAPSPKPDGPDGAGSPDHSDGPDRSEGNVITLDAFRKD